MVEIVPSLLSANFTRLESEIRTVEKAGAKRLHLDVMDGHFVPNITIGPFIVKAIRRITSLHIESHLMIQNPEKYIPAFIDAGSDTVIIHTEASKDIKADLDMIRRLGAKAGLVINPPTPFSIIEPFLPFIDHLLIMTVNPGFGWQKMVGEALDKIKMAKSFQSIFQFPIEIDGGVNTETIPLAIEAGANLLVAGSAIFGKQDPVQAFIELERVANP